MPGPAWWAIRLSPLLAATVVFLIGVPLAREQFNDYGASLPMLTVWLLEARRQAFSWHVGQVGGPGGYGVGKVALGALIVVAGFAAGLLVRAGRWRGAGAVILVVGLALLLLQVIVLAVPLLTMMRSLNA